MALAGTLSFIATVFVMVIVHESGHFVAAKRFGIKVEQFFIGFGPRIASWHRGETEYGIKAILLGGYVRIAGMNPWQTVPESDLPRTYGAKPAWQRAILLMAGSATHLVLAAAMLWALFWASGITGAPTTVIDSVHASLPGVTAPAAAAGLRRGDRIVELAGQKVTAWDQVRSLVRARPGQTVQVVIQRGGSQVPITVTLASAGEGSSRIGFLGVVPKLAHHDLSPPAALWQGIRTTGSLAKQSVIGIGKIFSPSGIGRVFSGLAKTGPRSPSEPVGLVGGARLAGQAASAGEIETLVGFLAGFVVFVGVINMAPLPPLDGGHLLVLGIEKLIRRPVDMKKVVPVAAFIVSLFVALSIALLYLDIIRPVQNPFQ